MRLIYILIVFFSVFFNRTIARNPDSLLVQFSGVVVTSDSITPVSFAHIQLKGQNIGVVADFYGCFSFVAKRGDSILISAMGFKDIDFLIPDTLSAKRYSLIQVMATDTIYLSETVISPWANYNQFLDAVVNANVPDDDLERARKNLELAAQKELIENMPLGSSGNYRSYVNQKSYLQSYKGQVMPSLTTAINNPLLNPFAWAQFIKAWKEGKFKRKKD